MKKRSLFLMMILLVAVLAGCRYNWILPEEDENPNPGGEPVSYSTQIQPIFTAKCISCHNTGGEAPDLSAGKSYNQVVPAHVNLTSPDQSDIYVYPSPTSSVHSWKKYSSNEAKLVLTWIEEGAKNN
jgi:mono/diheme cytochrome c family protein